MEKVDISSIGSFSINPLTTAQVSRNAGRQMSLEQGQAFLLVHGDDLLNHLRDSYVAFVRARLGIEKAE